MSASLKELILGLILTHMTSIHMGDAFPAFKKGEKGF
jgi:hypothetical protein